MKRFLQSCAAQLMLVLVTWNFALAESKVRTLSVPGGGQPFGAKTDGKGTIHLVFHGSDGPRYVSSKDSGKTFTKAISLLDRESRKPGLEYTIWDLAVSPDGHVHVALGTNAWKLKLPKEEWGFFYTRLDPGAREFNPVQNLNRKPSEGFSLAADDKGNVTACWMADKLFANVSHDNGHTFESTVEIDPKYDPCNCCTTSCTYGADGRLALLYREETNNSRDMFVILWDQERNLMTQSPVSTKLWKIDACPMTYYSITPYGDGYAAAWPTDGTIYFGRLDRQGKLTSPTERETPGAMGMRTGVLTLNNNHGETLVAWKKRDAQLGWQVYDQAGKPVGSAGSIQGAGPGTAGVVSKSGDFILFR